MAMGVRAPARQAPQQGVPFDFEGFDFSDFESGPAAQQRQARSGAPGGTGGGFRDIFSGIFNQQGGRQAAARPAAGHAISNTQSTWISGPPFAAAPRGCRFCGRRPAPPATAKRHPACRYSARSAMAQATSRRWAAG